MKCISRLEVPTQTDEPAQVVLKDPEAGISMTVRARQYNFEICFVCNEETERTCF